MKAITQIWRSLLLLAVCSCAVQTLAQQKPRPVAYFNPDWSPDGSKILFESTKDGKFALYTIGVDGSGLRKLTNGEANDEQARWSHDGRQIVFISDRDDGHSHIYLMNTDGSQQRRLTISSGTEFKPDLSPKSDLIAFTATSPGGSSTTEIDVVRADGTGRTRLIGENDSSNGSPRWSPNKIKSCS